MKRNEANGFGNGGHDRSVPVSQLTLLLIDEAKSLGESRYFIIVSRLAWGESISLRQAFEDLQNTISGRLGELGQLWIAARSKPIKGGGRKAGGASFRINRVGESCRFIVVRRFAAFARQFRTLFEVAEVSVRSLPFTHH